MGCSRIWRSVEGKEAELEVLQLSRQVVPCFQSASAQLLWNECGALKV